jgi:predicted transcriptional regulator
MRALEVIFYMLEHSSPSTETVRALAEIARVNPSTVSNVKDRLEKLGLVSTERLQVGGRPLRWYSVWPPRPPKELEGVAGDGPNAAGPVTPER